MKTRIEQGATEAAVAGDDEPAVPQPAVPEPSVPKHSKAKKMKRPAAASSIASSKRPKGSAQIECEDVTAAPMPEVSQRDDLLVAVAEPEASERDDLPAAVAEPEASFKDDLPTVVPAKPKAKAKSKAKAKAKVGSKKVVAEESEEEAGLSDGEFDKATVHFDAQSLHAAFYKGPQDVPCPPSSAGEDSEDEPVAESTDTGKRGRGRGGRGGRGGRPKGSGRGRGCRGKSAGAEEAEPKENKQKRGKGRGRGGCLENQLERVTFAKRPMPKPHSKMQLNRFMGIRDAFNAIIRPRVPEAPSKHEDFYRGGL